MATFTSASRVQELLPQLFQAKLPPGEPYLRFQLTAEMTALMSMKLVQESLLVAADSITPLPNMPLSVMGMISSRNRIFCVIDLAQLLELPSTTVSLRQYPIVVLQASAEAEIPIGVAVNRIQGITRLTPEQIQAPSGDFPPSLFPFVLTGFVAEGKHNLLVLDSQAIAARLHSRH